MPVLPADTAVFGDFTLDEEIKQAVEDTISEWIETYLALIERRAGLDPKSLPLPKSYVHSDDGTLNKRPEDQLPCVAILAPGNGKLAPKGDGEGRQRGGVVLNVAVIVETKSGSASLTSSRYRKALELLLLHQSDLGGIATETFFRGWRNDDLKAEDNRSIAAGVNVIEALIPNLSQAGMGLNAPPADPYEETEPPVVTEVDVELNPEEAK
jgi:hypothetical protein